MHLHALKNKKIKKFTLNREIAQRMVDAMYLRALKTDKINKIKCTLNREIADGRRDAFARFELGNTTGGYVQPRPLLFSFFLFFNVQPRPLLFRFRVWVYGYGFRGLGFRGLGFRG